MSRRAAPESPHRSAIVERLARDGDAHAMVLHGKALLSPHDERAGLAWIRRAARTLVAAQIELARRAEDPWGRHRGSPEAASLRREAIRWWRRAARSRHPDALRALAYDGSPVEGSRRARRALRRAARAGSAYAAYQLAARVETLKADPRILLRLLEGATRGPSADDEAIDLLEFVRRARPWLRRFAREPSAWLRRAQLGDPVARVHIGYARRFGRGLPYDPKDAQSEFERAADAGATEAQIALALMVWDLEADVDFDEAARWAARAAQSGDPLALFLAWERSPFATPAERRRAFRWLRASFERGEPLAANALSIELRCRTGLRHRREAARIARVGAEKGHRACIARYAGMLHDGEGVRRDARASSRWLKRLETRGCHDDWTNLGVKFHEGDGVRRDDRAAVRLYRRAAAHGDGHATANLGRCCRRGHGVRRDPALAARWFRRAAEVFENAGAAACLAEMYEQGEFGARDDRAATRWWRRAAALGDEEAVRALARAYEAGVGVRRDLAFARLLRQDAAFLERRRGS